MASQECREWSAPFPALAWAEGTVTTRDMRAVIPISPPVCPGHSLATWARRHTLLAGTYPMQWSCLPGARPC